VAAAVVVYQAMFWKGTIRYRLTLRAELNGVVAENSGVIEVIYANNIRILGSSGPAYLTGIKGEAVPIDFGEGHLLVAALSSGEQIVSSPEWIVQKAYDAMTVNPRQFTQPGVISGRRELSQDLWPLVLFFKNFSDPTSVEIINPVTSTTPLTGVPRIVAVEIEIVDPGIWPIQRITGTPVTHSILGYLPWLENKADRRRLSETLHNKAIPVNSSREPFSLFKRGH